MKLRLRVIIALVFLANSALADSKDYVAAPMMVGPQYPIMFLSTVFVPDTAFVLDENDFYVASTYSVVNSYVLSRNSGIKKEQSSDPSYFSDLDNNGYSVYMDVEMERRLFRFYYGISSNLQLQFTYRDFGYVSGTLDESIENFHTSLQIDNQNRDLVDRNKLALYIHDNETKENIYIVTEESPGFMKESATIGFKYRLFGSDSSAFSFGFSSNYGDYYVERGVNESTSMDEFEEHSDFNDQNYSFLYTSKYDGFTLHAAYSSTIIKTSLLPKSPKRINYMFLGINGALSDKWYYVLQGLRYTSPFPKVETSTIGEDVLEIAGSFRWLFRDNILLEIGFVENQTQGAQNVDIALLTNLMFYL